MSDTIKTVIVSGAQSLYRLAVDQYADPLDFISILQSNNLESPFLVQPQSIVLPKSPPNNGGKPTQPAGKGVGIIQPVVVYPYTTETNANVTSKFFTQGEVYSLSEGRGKIQPSIDGTLITVGTGGTLTDTANGKWTIINNKTITIPATITNPVTSTALVGQVALNGVVDNSSTNVIAMAYTKGVIYYQDVNLFWYAKAWVTPVLQDGPYTYPQFNDIAITDGITYFLDGNDNTYRKTILANSWSDGSLDSPLLTAFLLAVVVPSITLPGAVLPLTSNVTQTSLTVFWTAPTGTQPVYYQVQYRVSGSNLWLNVGSSSTATSVSIVNLTPNTVYQLQVLTFNALGSSLEAPLVLTFQTAFGATAPGAVNPVVSSVAAQAIVVAWNVPIGTAPFTYEVFYRISGTTNFATTTSTSALNEGITGLQPNTSYDFKVAAANSVGIGPSSAIVTATTTSVPVGSVGTPVITNVGQTSLTISWNVPIGTPPFTYLLQDRFTGTTDWTTLLITSATTFNVTNLIDLQSYDFQVIPRDATVASTVPPTIVSMIVQVLFVANATATSFATAVLTTNPQAVATMSSNVMVLPNATAALTNHPRFAAFARVGVTRGLGNLVQNRSGNLINSSNGNSLSDALPITVNLTTSPKGALISTVNAMAGVTATLTNKISLAANVQSQSVVNAPITVTALVQSPQGFTVNTVGPAVIGTAIESFTITSGGQIAISGVVDTTTSSVILLLMWNNLVYQENSGGVWYFKSISSDVWSAPTTDPRVGNIVQTRIGHIIIMRDGNNLITGS